MTWTPDKPLDERCPHYNPEAAGYGLHGVCIFCWRDRAAALRAEVAALEKYSDEREEIWNDVLRDSAARAAEEMRERAAHETETSPEWGRVQPWWLIKSSLAERIRALPLSPTIPAGEPTKEEP